MYSYLGICFLWRGSVSRPSLLPVLVYPTKGHSIHPPPGMRPLGKREGEYPLSEDLTRRRQPNGTTQVNCSHSRIRGVNRSHTQTRTHTQEITELYKRSRNRIPFRGPAGDSNPGSRTTLRTLLRTKCSVEGIGRGSKTISRH